MNKRRYLGFGLLLAAGCAGHATTRPAVSHTHLNTTSATQPALEPKWEPAGDASASDLLSQKAAEYAQRMQTPDPAPQATQVDPTPNKAGRKPARMKATDAPGDPVPAAVDANAQLASLRGDAPAAKLNDPRMVPESADFQSPGSPKTNGDPLGDRLRKRIAQNPRDLADQLDLQLFGLLTDDPTAELASVSALPNDDRELVAALMDGLSNFRSTVRQDGSLLAAQKIKPLLEMADRLRSQADLTVSNVALCRRVDGYGKYDPISPAKFPAGRENAAIVYCEVENFLTRQNARRMWETKLSEQVTLYTDSGMLAWSDSTQHVTDECRNRRHDFFAYNVIHLPANLTLGRYFLKVSVEDQNANRVAEATIPVSIAAQ